MVESGTIAAVTTAAFLGEFAWEMFKHVCGGLTHHKVDQAIESAAKRFTEGRLPHNHHLETALYRALGSATCCLAYHLHDPKRGPMRDLLEKISDWPEFLERFQEAVQNNIIVGDARSAWLANLIDETKDPNNFADFSLSPVLDENQLTRLLRDESDAELRGLVHSAFLAWVEKHAPDNGHKPPDFAQRVEEGWRTSGHGKALAFYDVFCLFFRENLKDETEVFRAFSISVLAGLKQDVEEIKKSLPDAKTLSDFTETLRTFEEKEFDANYARFKVWTRKQNDKLYSLMRTEFAGVHEHLAKQDTVLENIKIVTSTHRKESEKAFRETLI